MEPTVNKEIKIPDILDYYLIRSIIDNRSDNPEPYEPKDITGNIELINQFRRKWYFVDDGMGVRLPFVVAADNTLKRKVPDELCRDISSFCLHAGHKSKFYSWSPEKLDKATDFVIRNSKSVISFDEIPMVGWRSSQFRSLFRLPFDRIPIAADDDPLAMLLKDAPVFSEFLGRFESEIQAVAYCQWLGAIVEDHDNLVQKGVILYGEGRNGKSTQLRFLDSILADGVRYKDCGSKSEFKSDGIERCRVLAYADVSDRNIFTDAAVKGYIGGDRIEINRKNAAQFTVKPRVKVIACTNKIPNIRNNIAETRRWIYCDIKGFDGETDPTYQDKLNAEAQVIMSCCAEMFCRLENKSDITTDPEALTDVTDMTDSGVKYFCEKYFRQTPGGFVSNFKISVLIDADGTVFEKSRVINMLKNVYGAKRGRRYDNKETIRGLVGVSLTSDANTKFNYASPSDSDRFGTE
jgi:hypothetical protein